MANVVMKVLNNSVSIEFNDMSVGAQTKKSKWRQEALVAVFVTVNDAVIVRTIYKQDFMFCCAAQPISNCLLVDSVDGVQPTDNAHLFELISKNIN